eukprot:2875495-Prymnesium_polylepis.1
MHPKCGRTAFVRALSVAQLSAFSTALYKNSVVTSRDDCAPGTAPGSWSSQKIATSTEKGAPATVALHLSVLWVAVRS